MLAASAPAHGGDCPRIMGLVRGNRMAKATLENAIWDLEGAAGGDFAEPAAGWGSGCDSLWGLYRDSIVDRRDAGRGGARGGGGVPADQAEVQAGLGYRTFEKVRGRFPGITLSCDANSAYRLRDADHLASFDHFNLLMVEQPLWYDDFYYHSMLAEARLDTAICLDESIRNGGMRWRRLRWSPAGLSISSWGGWVAFLRQLRCIMRRMSAGPGVVWRDAGVGDWAFAQYCVVNA